MQAVAGALIVQSRPNKTAAIWIC